MIVEVWSNFQSAPEWAKWLFVAAIIAAIYVGVMWWTRNDDKRGVAA